MAILIKMALKIIVGFWWRSQVFKCLQMSSMVGMDEHLDEWIWMNVHGTSEHFYIWHMHCTYKMKFIYFSAIHTWSFQVPSGDFRWLGKDRNAWCVCAGTEDCTFSLLLCEQALETRLWDYDFEMDMHNATMSTHNLRFFAYFPLTASSQADLNLQFPASYPCPRPLHLEMTSSTTSGSMTPYLDSHSPSAMSTDYFLGCNSLSNLAELHSQFHTPDSQAHLCCAQHPLSLSPNSRCSSPNISIPMTWLLTEAPGAEAPAISPPKTSPQVAGYVRSLEHDLQQLKGTLHSLRIENVSIWWVKYISHWFIH